MLVKDIIISALTAMEQSELALAVQNGLELSEEQSQTVTVLMHCYNAVEDELARLYFPLAEEYTAQTVNGQLYYTQFPNAPIKIKSVTKNGKKLKYRLYPKYLKTAAKEVRVLYCYSPKKKSIDGDCEVRETVSDRLIYYGMLAEYYLICGLAEVAERWESKYRNEIEAAQSTQSGTLRQRSWV